MFKLPLPYLRIMTEIGLRNSAKLKQLMDTYKSVRPSFVYRPQCSRSLQRWLNIC